MTKKANYKETIFYSSLQNLYRLSFGFNVLKITWCWANSLLARVYVYMFF